MLWVILLLLAPFIQGQVIKPVLYECLSLPEPIGQVCVNVTSRDCFDLTGTVTVRGSAVVGPRQVSIPQLVNIVSSRGPGAQTFCESIDFSSFTLPIPPCSLCTVVESLKINGDDLNFCGKLSVNCSLPSVGQVKRDIPVPCLNITDCRFGCSRGCNTGTCSATGICNCPAGYYGSDCSFQISQNCLVSKVGARQCWTPSAPNCNTIQIKKSSGTVEYPIANSTTAELVPCEVGLITSTDSRCKLCLSADQLHMEGTSVVGRPIAKEVCGGLNMGLSKYGPSYTLLTNVASCDGSKNDNSNSAESWGTAKTILVILVVVLVIGIISVGSYFGYHKYQDWKDTEAFMRVPNHSDDMASVNLTSEVDGDGSDVDDAQ